MGRACPPATLPTAVLHGLPLCRQARPRGHRLGPVRAAGKAREAVRREKKGRPGPGQKKPSALLRRGMLQAIFHALCKETRRTDKTCSFRFRKTYSNGEAGDAKKKPQAACLKNAYGMPRSGMLRGCRMKCCINHIELYDVIATRTGLA